MYIFKKGEKKKEIITQKHAKPAKRQSQPIGSRLTRKILDSIADVSNCSATLLRKGILSTNNTQRAHAASCQQQISREAISHSILNQISVNSVDLSIIFSTICLPARKILKTLTTSIYVCETLRAKTSVALFQIGRSIACKWVHYLLMTLWRA